jgi:hypothetical protein
MTAIKLNKLDWLSSAINHIKHERVHVCFCAGFSDAGVTRLTTR